MEAVHHLEVAPQVFLGQVVEHPGIHQALHEVGAVLRQAEAGQPLVAYPLVVHVAVGQRLRGEEDVLSLFSSEEKCVVRAHGAEMRKI